MLFGAFGDRMFSNVHKYGRRMLFHMDKLRWDSMRMRTVGFECHLMPSGKYGVVGFVFGDLGTLGIFADRRSRFDTQDMQTNTGSAPSFAVYNPSAWSAFRQAFTGYVKHIAALEKDSPNNAEQISPSATYTFENMTYAPSGLPLLPEAVKNEFGTETKKMQQAILRVYLSKHYSGCSY